MIYLDHNATTPILPEVAEAMRPWLTTEWGNPSSAHRLGRAASRAVDQARERVARLVGAESENVIFTSGATEANNAALHSAVFSTARKRHVVTSVVEHSAVLSYCDYLERIHNVEVTRLPVNSDGALDLDELRGSIRDDTALVSLMWANNETGVVWPISEFGTICRETQTHFHSDAVQAVAKIPVSFTAAGLDFLTLSGHKIGAPKGVGAVVVRDRDLFLPFVHGGKQEGGHRGGTENVACIVGLGVAAEIAIECGRSSWEQVKVLRDRLENEVLDRIEGAQINGERSDRLPNTTNLHFPGIDGDSLVTFLDQKGIFTSSGSACLESAIAPSHVLLAMTGSHDRSSESIRISLGLNSTQNDIQVLHAALESFVLANA